MENNIIKETQEITVEEFFEKMKTSGKYVVYDCNYGLFDEEKGYGINNISIFEITDNDMIINSPFYTFNMVQQYCYTIYAGDYRLMVQPDDKISKLIYNMEISIERYYTTLIRNIKKVISSGYAYILDSSWNTNEYEYIKKNAEKYDIEYWIDWDGSPGNMYIRRIGDMKAKSGWEF